MSSVIYVDLSGEAYTIDEIHERAMVFNQFYDGTFRQRLIVLGRAIEKAVKAIVEVFKKAWTGIKSVVAIFEEQMAEVVIPDPKGGMNWEWLKTYHKRNAECHLKRGSKQQMNFTRSKAWASFKRYQRRRGI
jgi:hypothetical protein